MLIAILHCRCHCRSRVKYLRKVYAVNSGICQRCKAVCARTMQLVVITALSSNLYLDRKIRKCSSVSSDFRHLRLVDTCDAVALNILSTAAESGRYTLLFSKASTSERQQMCKLQSLKGGSASQNSTQLSSWIASCD
jgi:hypothetical protein